MGTREYLLEQAKKEGFEIGIEQGIEKGKRIVRLALENKIRHLVLSLKVKGLTMEEIAKVTGLSRDEIVGFYGSYNN